MMARLVALIAFLSGCGEGEPVSNQHRAEDAPAARVAAPIHGSDEAQAMPAPPLPPSVSAPKALVSRGTPARQAGPPDYRAIGTEPFWAVTVRGATALLERPDHKPVRVYVEVNRDDRAIRYLGNGFTMTATEGPCSDGMSDAIWSDRVAIAFGGGTLKGCGGLREDMQDDAP